MNGVVRNEPVGQEIQWNKPRMASVLARSNDIDYRASIPRTIFDMDTNRQKSYASPEYGSLTTLSATL
jgi:hypothetical protein